MITMEFDEINDHYISGVLDAAGYLQLTKQQGRIITKISIMSANREYLQAMATKTSVGRIYVKRNIYVWLIQAHEEVKQFLKRLHPYLITQKKRASHILEYLDTGKVPAEYEPQSKKIVKPKIIKFL